VISFKPSLFFVVKQEPEWNLSYDFRLPDGDSRILRLELINNNIAKMRTANEI
jgi:hypothetical protein